MRQGEENIGHPDAFQGYSLQNQKTSHQGPTHKSSTISTQEAGPRLLNTKVCEILESPTVEKCKDKQESEIFLSNAQGLKIKLTDS